MSRELNHRIQMHLEFAWRSKQQEVDIGEIELFGLLSEKLNSELQLGLSIRVLSIRPLFKRMDSVSFVSMHRLAANALSFKE